MTIPPGEYHADLYLHRPSGIVLKLTLPNQIVSVIRKERLAIEIPLALENEQLVSGERSHIDFGLGGDTVNTVVREFSIRSLEVDYPLPVRLESQIADPDGNVPQTAWLRFNPASIILQPGKAQKIRVTLTLPKDIESQIVDGVFDGQIVAENAETRQPLTLERFEPISGVPADAPVQRLTFELKRPRFFIEVPWALRNWTKQDSEKGTLVRVRQDVDRPFQRTVQVRVRHSSAIARDVTVLPSGLLKDTEGRSISELRLVTAPDSESTRSVAAGQTETWEFVFEADQQTTIAKAVTGIDVQGDGLVTEHLNLEVISRPTMLSPAIAVCLAGLVTILIVVIAVRFPLLKSLSRYATGNVLQISAGLKRPPLVAVGSLMRDRLNLIPQVELQTANSVTGSLRRLPANQVVPVLVNQISSATPFQASVPSENETLFQITDVTEGVTGPEVTLEILDGGDLERSYWRLARTLKLAALLTAFALLLIVFMKQPVVVTSLQWVHDLIVGW